MRVKIKSKTDVITNSSTEVFIIKRNNLPDWTEKGEESNCIYTYDFNNMDAFKGELFAVCDLLGIDYKNDNTYDRYWNWTDDQWDFWYELYKNELENIIKEDYVFVEIKDHYDFDSYDIDRERAESYCVWLESRH